VAALVACAIARKNRSARILPFENNVVEVKLNHSRPVLENAAKLASIGGGGTNCSAPMQLLNAENAKGDLVLYVSDNQSWMDAGVAQGGTELMKQWAIYKGRNPKAKLVCLDIQPYAHTQAREQDDILNIGGFSDQVFEVISEFANGTLNADHWVGEIQKVTF
ncbi:MAG: RNA-binding protein, partial [Verrucomicrobiales bacterium]